MPYSRQYYRRPRRTGRRSATTRYIRRVAARQDDRILKRTEGAWWIGYQRVPFSVSVGNNSAAYLGLRVPNPENTSVPNQYLPNRDHTTIYALNSIITLTYKGAGNATKGPIVGALAAFTAKEPAQGSGSNFWTGIPAIFEDANKATQPKSNQYPFRWVQYFAVSQDTDGSARRFIVFPFSFRGRSRQVKLAHDEAFCLTCQTEPNGDNAGQIEFGWHYRFRYIQTSD